MTDSGSAHRGIAHFFLNLLRIGTGLLFMQHGAQKLFAVLGREEAAAVFTQMWLAGVLEFWGGLLIVLGLFTRPVALILVIEMVWAYVQAHVPRGPWPILNGGERSLLFALVFVYLAALGGGAFSLDGWWAARKRGRTVG